MTQKERMDHIEMIQAKLASCIEHGHRKEYNEVVRGNRTWRISHKCKSCGTVIYRDATKKELRAMRVLGVLRHSGLGAK